MLRRLIQLFSGEHQKDIPTAHECTPSAASKTSDSGEKSAARAIIASLRESRMIEAKYQLREWWVGLNPERLLGRFMILRCMSPWARVLVLDGRALEAGRYLLISCSTNRKATSSTASKACLLVHTRTRSSAACRDRVPENRPGVDFRRKCTKTCERYLAPTG